MEVLVADIIERQQVHIHDALGGRLGTSGEQAAASEDTVEVALARHPARFHRGPNLDLLACGIVVEGVSEVVEQQAPAGGHELGEFRQVGFNAGLTMVPVNERERGTKSRVGEYERRRGAANEHDAVSDPVLCRVPSAAAITPLSTSIVCRTASESESLIACAMRTADFP
jgi:hypothetical protein